MINQADIKQELLDFHNHAGSYAELASNTDSVFIQEKVATLWKNIISKGFMGIMPTSTTVSVAADTLYASLNLPDAGTAIYAFYASAMTTIGSGMVGYSTVSPPIPLVLNSPLSDIDASCDTLAGQLVACASTGQSMMVSPPNTVLIWS